MAKTNYERIQKSLENASAVLCNITSTETLRRRIVVETVIPVLTATVLVPAAETAYKDFDSFSGNNLPLQSTILYRNCTAVIRYIQCSNFSFKARDWLGNGKKESQRLDISGYVSI